MFRSVGVDDKGVVTWFVGNHVSVAYVEVIVFVADVSGFDQVVRGCVVLSEYGVKDTVDDDLAWLKRRSSAVINNQSWPVV